MLAQTEEGLLGLQKQEKLRRRFDIAGGSVLLGVGVAAAVTVGVASATPRHWGLGQDALTAVELSSVALASFGAWTLITGLLQRSTSDRLIEVWQKDPAMLSMPRLSVAPVRGGGMLALSGQF